MKALRAIAASALLLPWSASASDGFRFLELQSDARRAALGGAGTALADDAAGIASNPAGLGEAGRDELSLSYMTYAVDTSLGSAAYVHPLATGGVGLRVLTLDYGTLDGFDATGGRASPYSATDLSLSAAYGRPWGSSWRWGASLGQVQSSVGDLSAETVEAGAGVLWAPPGTGALSRLRLGAALRHAGSGAAFEKESAALPRVLAAGMSWRGFSEAWVLAVDAEKPRTGGTRLRAGQELWLSQVLVLRAGWQSDQDLAGSLSLGLGVRFRDLRVDYAFAGGDGSFDNVHRMGISWKFGGKVEALYEEAARALQKGDSAEAVLKLKKVLDLDPRHRRALALIREAALQMQREGLNK